MVSTNNQITVFLENRDQMAIPNATVVELVEESLHNHTLNSSEEIKVLEDKMLVELNAKISMAENISTAPSPPLPFGARSKWQALEHLRKETTFTPLKGKRPLWFKIQKEVFQGVISPGVKKRNFRRSKRIQQREMLAQGKTRANVSSTSVESSSGKTGVELRSYN